MNANELVIVARLASHYEDAGVDDPLDTAKHDVIKIKREAPLLWRCLWDNSKMTSRDIGDYLYRLVRQWQGSGVSFRNFAADVFDRECR